MSVPADLIGGMYHPWRDLRLREDVYVSWRADLPTHAATNGDVILMRVGLTQAERRCALAHELVHIDLGHETAQPPAVERAVEGIAARRLITMDALIREAQWAVTVDEWAEALWVTPAVLHHRIRDLSAAERGMLAMLIRRAQDDEGGQNGDDRAV